MLSRNLSIETLEKRVALSCSDVCISEFLASNQESVADFYGESSDWIEIYNPTEHTVDLQGWHLTDDPTQVDKWTFPDVLPLGSQSRLLVWASGRDRVDPSGAPHTNFKLNASGEYVGLARPDGSVISSYGDGSTEYLAQSTDVSYGTDQEGLVRFFLDPTPGEPNSLGALGFVDDTKFSVDRGFFDEPFSLTISTATPNATLVYTLDGSPPSPTHGTRVQGDSQNTQTTITIDRTATVRAMAFRDGWEPTNVDTQTYVFAEQVIRQTGDGLPTNWGHAGPDYEMDPRIVDSNRYRDQIVDGLKSLPTLSLVSDIDNWFDRRNGIYPEGSGSPVPVSAELLFADDTDGFQVDGSVEIQGGSSTNRWKSDKLSMQLKFKRDLGDAKLEYPLFGVDATDEFDTLIIDARLNQVWHYGGGYEATKQRTKAQYTRDQFVADLQNGLGGHAPHGRWVHVYLNGIYWGIHNLHERPDEHFASEYFGGEDEDYDIIKHNNDVVNGSLANYRLLLNAVNGDTRRDDRYAEIEQMLDVDSFIDYMQLNYFVGNVDWAHHNWYASYNKTSGEGRWRFHSWDAEHVMKGINDDATDRDDAQGPTHIHVRLMRNEQYRTKFMDAVQRNFFNSGMFTPEKAGEMYQVRLDEVYAALVPESARWGDNRRDQPYTRDNEWVRERDRLLNEYFPRRTDIVIGQLRNRGFFHDFDAPKFNLHGGEVDSGFHATIAGEGELFYTTDGSDPRSSATRQVYGDAIEILQPTTIRVRSRVGDSWSALVAASFVPRMQALPGDLSLNGSIDPTDIDLLTSAVRENDTDTVFDLNQDDVVDQLDVEHWIVQIAQTRRGDVNLDGVVSFADFLVISQNFGSTEVGWAEGDANGDGGVGFQDFLLLRESFGP